jgi:ABC-2 type transport system permease protein
MRPALPPGETNAPIANSDGQATHSTWPDPRPHGRLLTALQKYSKIFRISLIERMVYRADFLLSTFLRFLPMLTTILLWQAIYTGAGKQEEGQLAGWRFREMIAYLLLVHISRMFSSMPGLAYGIARDVREGSIKKYLLQPIDMVAYLVSYRIAHKVAYIVTSALPYGLLFFLCRDFFDGLPDPVTMLAYLASLLLAFLVGFFFEASFGMVSFWFLEVTSFLYVANTVNFFISGQMFPLDLLSPFWAGLLKALPFQFLAYFPATIFLGKVQGLDIVYGLLGEVGWALVFIVLTRVLFRFGLRRYSAFGG